MGIFDNIKNKAEEVADGVIDDKIKNEGLNEKAKEVVDSGLNKVGEKFGLTNDETAEDSGNV